MRLLLALWTITFLACSLAQGQELPRIFGGPPHSYPGDPQRFLPQDPRELANLLKSKDKDVRAAAAYSLAYFSKEPEKVVMELIGALGDPEPEVRTKAAVALAYRESHARSAVPALVGLLRDKDVDARRASVFALTMIQPDLKHVEARLLKALKDDDKPVRIRAAYALWLLGHKGKGPFDALAEGLADEKDHEVRGLASRMASRVGLPALPTIMRALQDKRPDTRRAASHAMRRVVAGLREDKIPVPKEAIQALIVALKDDEEEVVGLAISALGGVGDEAKEAIPLIAAFLNHRDRIRRMDAARILGYFGPAAKVAIPALKQALQDEDSTVRAVAAETLKALEK